jgi:hypothetical protein
MEKTSGSYQKASKVSVSSDLREELYEICGGQVNLASF